MVRDVPLGFLARFELFGNESTIFLVMLKEMKSP